MFKYFQKMIVQKYQDSTPDKFFENVRRYHVFFSGGNPRVHTMTPLHPSHTRTTQECTQNTSTSTRSDGADAAASTRGGDGERG